MVAVMKQEGPGPSWIDYGVAAQTLRGEAVCGDACLVKEFDHHVLLAVVDGSGHGPEAAAAAAAAISVLKEHAPEPPAELIKRCHQTLASGRGVAMTLITIRAAENALSWTGVGNVFGGLFRAEQGAPRRTETVGLRGGIVGYQLPRLHSGEMAIAPGDWLVLATDGVRVDFSEDVNLRCSPREVASRILARHGKGNDDALVLAACYRGNGHE
jgi:negative regulator of sigma-B (phosphoserine phosphatase)